MEDDLDHKSKRQKLALTDTDSSEQQVLDARPGAACLLSREKIQARDRDYVHYFALSVGGEQGCDQYVYQVHLKFTSNFILQISGLNGFAESFFF